MCSTLAIGCSLWDVQQPRCLHKLEHDFNHRGSTFRSVHTLRRFYCSPLNYEKCPTWGWKSIFRRKQQQNFWAHCTGRNCVSLDGRRQQGAKYNVSWSKQLTGTNRHDLLSLSDTPAASGWADVPRAEPQASSRTSLPGLQPKASHLEAPADKIILWNVPVCQNNHAVVEGAAIYILN